MSNGNALRKFSFLMSAFIAGLCLFAAITSLKLESSLFDPGLHKSMLKKYDVYSQTGNILTSSLDDYLKTLGSGSSEDLKQQEQLVSFIKKAITPEMIKLNIDSILEGLIKYFRNETRFLPDVYINPDQQKPAQELQTNTDKDDKIDGKSIVKIDKINLSVILMYMNRTDMTDKFSIVRLLQFTLAKIPLLAGLLFAVSLLSGFLLMKNKNELIHWVKVTALLTGYTFAISGISLLIYLYYIFPVNHGFISLSVPLQAKSAMAYIQNWLYSPALFYLIVGIALILFVPVFKLLTKFTSGWKNIAWFKKSIPVKNSRIEINGRKHGIKPVFVTISLLSILFITFLYFGTLKREFLSNDLTVSVERMKGITAFSRVVFAQDAAVNTLELRIVDRKANTPIKGIYTNISGKSATSGNSFNETVVSDDEGKSKTTLDIGAYKLSFDSTRFPDDYKPPPPYLFEMEAAGSTVITISLDKIEEPKPGIIEIQILDKDSLPLKGIELALVNAETETVTLTEGNAYSFTNSEGVAAFRTGEGVYKISFPDNGLPSEYLLPDPIEIDLAPDETARYSIKLVKKSIHSIELADKKQKSKK